ncbi:phage adaptor protein [Glutamicibacter sp.]|uniref:phage adaptor protein n=1 Tax=Glutamicibacter sp. TaxID=1931995 RepID=UPI002FDA430D
MATLLQLRTSLKRTLIDPNARYVADSVYTEYINKAQDQFAHDTEALEHITGFSVTTGVNRVTPPADFIRPRKFTYKDQWDLTPQDIINFTERWGFMGSFNSWPMKYTIFEDGIRLWPAPSETSTATTMNDPGGINATDASVILTSAAAFPTNGIITIESEKIEYFGKTSNTLNNLRRGIGGTVAAAHADATAVTLAFLRMAYYARFKTLVADGDVSEVPDRYTHILIYYAAHLGWLDNTDLGMALKYRDLYDKTIVSVAAAVDEEQRESPAIVQSIDRHSRMYL